MFIAVRKSLGMYILLDDGSLKKWDMRARFPLADGKKKPLGLGIFIFEALFPADGKKKPLGRGTLKFP